MSWLKPRKGWKRVIKILLITFEPAQAHAKR